ncbi:Chaperone J-domain superfamily [Arabidopsis thaliana x Arabidopsis arenosa]|uniref:Chaperone J-domain superfamily n=1 Tax=Arabidopsis thaliana x Arabidopsis arenosa TaxID=1240361 RepID=A0A8T2AYY6_9BRAS|nr:Chaperone J-domain superfamily [Arabidopsis thaliana x Arabidopsis arenosa]
MLSSSSTFFATPFLSSSSSRSVSPVSPPSRVSRNSPSLSATTASYTCADDPTRLRQIPQRFSATASLYEILEIPVSSTGQEIKSAYRRLARICHPDVAGNSRNDSSADDFMKIHAAYCTLSDPEKRAVYDRRNLRRSRPLTVGVSGYGSYAGRNWETDQCW